MKTISFLVTAFCLLFISASCDDNDNEPRNEQNKIVGSWNLTRITGGFAGTGYPADFTDVEFKSNGTYRINNQDEAKGDGTYNLVNETDNLILKLVPSDSVKIGFEQYDKTVTFDKEKLILSDPCCDLYTYEFGSDEN